VTPRRLILLPLMAVVLAGAGLAAVLGVRAATTTETEVIARVAALYVAEAGGGAARTDCRARPARSAELWLLVICERDGRGRQYFIDRFGRVADRGTLGGRA
jgi:peptidoglycan/LPS O-acetylase OafA/YrhL